MRRRSRDDDCGILYPGLDFVLECIAFGRVDLYLSVLYVPVLSSRDESHVGSCAYEGSMTSSAFSYTDSRS